MLSYTHSYYLSIDHIGSDMIILLIAVYQDLVPPSIDNSLRKIVVIYFVCMLSAIYLFKKTKRLILFI